MEDVTLTMAQLNDSSLLSHAASSEVFALLSEVAGPSQALVLVEGGKAWAKGSLRGKENSSPEAGVPPTPEATHTTSAGAPSKSSVKFASVLDEPGQEGGMLAAAWMLRAQELERKCADLRNSTGRQVRCAEETLAEAHAAIAEMEEVKAARSQAESESKALFEWNCKLEKEVRAAARRSRLAQSLADLLLSRANCKTLKQRAWLGWCTKLQKQLQTWRGAFRLLARVNRQREGRALEAWRGNSRSSRVLTVALQRTATRGERLRAGRTIARWKQGVALAQRGWKVEAAAVAFRGERISRSVLLGWWGAAVHCASVRASLGAAVDRSGALLCAKGSLRVWRRSSPRTTAHRTALLHWAIDGWVQRARRRKVEGMACGWMLARRERGAALCALGEWHAAGARRRVSRYFCARRAARRRRGLLVAFLAAWRRLNTRTRLARAAKRRHAERDQRKVFGIMCAAARTSRRLRRFLQVAGGKLLGRSRQKGLVTSALACGRARWGSVAIRAVVLFRKHHARGRAFTRWARCATRERKLRLGALTLLTRTRLSAAVRALSSWRELRRRAVRSEIVYEAGVARWHEALMHSWAGWLRVHRVKARARRLLGSLGSLGGAQRRRGVLPMKREVLRSWAWLAAGRSSRIQVWRELTQVRSDVASLRARISGALERPAGVDGETSVHGLVQLLEARCGLLAEAEAAVTLLVQEAAAHAEPLLSPRSPFPSPRALSPRGLDSSGPSSSQHRRTPEPVLQESH